MNSLSIQDYCKVKIYSSQTKLSLVSKIPSNVGGVRGKITSFSSGSCRRAKLFALNCVSDTYSPVDFDCQILLTYPCVFPTDMGTCEYHKNRFFKFLKSICPDLHYIWFKEFQVRGAVHFHIICDCYDFLRENIAQIAQAWVNICYPSDMTYLDSCEFFSLGGFDSFPDAKIFTDLTLTNYFVVPRFFNDSFYREKPLRFFIGVDNSEKTCIQPAKSKGGLVRYMTKYFSKLEQKSCPCVYESVGRFWGHSKNLVNPVVCGVVKIKDIYDYVCDLRGVDFAVKFCQEFYYYLNLGFLDFEFFEFLSKLFAIGNIEFSDYLYRLIRANVPKRDSLSLSSPSWLPYFFRYRVAFWWRNYFGGYHSFTKFL